MTFEPIAAASWIGFEQPARTDVRHLVHFPLCERAGNRAWASGAGEGVSPNPTGRSQDRSFVGNVVEAMVACAEGRLGSVDISLTDVDELIIIGSDLMMTAAKRARRENLAQYLNPKHAAIGSINSLMQCMMKGVCAQSLCSHIDTETGGGSFVYSYYNQDQPLDHVDFTNLRPATTKIGSGKTIQPVIGSFVKSRCKLDPKE